MLLHLPHWSIQTRNRFLIFGVWVIKYYDVQFPFELFVLVFVICMEASIRTSKYTERNMQFRLSVCRYVCVFFRSRSLSFSLIFPKFTAFGTQSMAGRKYRNDFQIDPNSRLYAYTISHRHTTCKTLFLVWGEWGVWQSSSLLQKFERAALQKCSLYWRYIRFKAFSDNVQIRESTKCVEFASVPFFLLEVHTRKTEWYLQLTSHTELK